MRFVIRVQVDCGLFTTISFRQSKETKDLGLYMTDQRRVSLLGSKSETHELIYTANTPISDKIIENIITNFDETPNVLGVEVIEYEE